MNITDILKKTQRIMNLGDNAYSLQLKDGSIVTLLDYLIISPAIRQVMAWEPLDGDELQIFMERGKICIYSITPAEVPMYVYSCTKSRIIYETKDI